MPRFYIQLGQKFSRNKQYVIMIALIYQGMSKISGRKLSKEKALGEVLRGDLIKVFKYLKSGSKQQHDRLLSVDTVKKTRINGFIL